MTDTPVTVLLIGATAPIRTALEGAVPELVENGAEVYLAAYRLSAPDLAGVRIRDMRLLQPRIYPSGTRRFSPRWVVRLPRRLLIRLVEKYGDLAGRVWTTARRDPWLVARAAQADVLVALDPAAAWTVWKLARRHPGTTAVNGLPAAVDAVRER
ncbi:MAG: hypothetical protein QOG53_1091 [Frankiales bacterium]|jgi:hypothetical protein|nr:hypothetical protein [Frankiales bacterium]